MGPDIADNAEAAAMTDYAYTLGARTMNVPLHDIQQEFLSQLKGRE